MKTKVFSKPDESRDRLAELGLDALTFVQAIQRGNARAAGYTPNHPPICRGISLWGEVVAAIRDQLIPRDWTRSESENFSLTLNSTRTIAIAVATGDECTGRPDASPSTRSAKGPTTASAVIVNALQLNLFRNVPLKSEELKRANGVTTFIFLFHRDANAHETRFELSQPTRMTPEGHVEEWGERIIFPPVPFGEPAKTKLKMSPEILPKVKRKSA